VARDTGSLHSYGQELARALDQVDSLQQTLDAAVARAEKAEGENIELRRLIDDEIKGPNAPYGGV